MLFNVVAATALLVARRRFEALLVGVSVVMATSDVLAAMCLGAFMPPLISVTKDLSHRNESDIDIATAR